MLHPSVDDRYILSSGGQTFSVTTGGMALYTKYGYLSIRFVTRTPPKIWAVEDVVVKSDTWHSVALTWRQDGDLTVYLDGKLQRQVSSTKATIVDPEASSVMYVGKNNIYEGKFGEVCLDEWFFWGRVLNSQEVRAVYSSYIK